MTSIPYKTAGRVGGGLAGRVVGGIVGGFFGPLGVLAGQAVGARLGSMAGAVAGTAVATMMENEDGKIEEKTEEAAPEKTCVDCDEATQKAKDAKRMSKSELDKAAKQNGFKGAHDLKRELKLKSDVDIFVDKDGEMYKGPRKGTGIPERIYLNKNGFDGV